MDISYLREEYTRIGFSLNTLKECPFEQFALWFDQAQQAKITEPNAMSLATSTVSGVPSLRTVLLKYFDKSGFVFFTNYTSKKSNDITSNHNVAILFPWIALGRQVIVQGQATKIPVEQSQQYFDSRPYDSQLGAWVSRQSTVIPGRETLESELKNMKRKFKNGKVPMPEFWGGYCVVPNKFEFWQGRPGRLHDRFQYTLFSIDKNTQWNIERLSP